MNIYLATFDKKSEEDVRIILDMFSKDKGDIKFLPLKLKKKAEYFKKYKKLVRLHLNDFNDILNEVKSYVEMHHEYVVLITDKGLDIPIPENVYAKDWNSAFINKNIVVNSSRWVELTEDRSYLAIAHQIIENLFQALSHVTITSETFIDDIHNGISGCINDYCADFDQIYAKILSGKICKKCHERFLAFEQEKELVQLKKILRRISNRITDNFVFEVNTNKKIVVNKYGDIRLGASKLNFRKAKIVRHSYLFYLINYNKIISSQDLQNNQEVRQKFLELSTLDGLNLNPYEMDMYINNIRTHQTRTKKYLLNSLIDENLFDCFSIKGKTEKDETDPTKKNHYYQINVDNESEVEIDPSLLKYRLN